MYNKIQLYLTAIFVGIVLTACSDTFQAVDMESIPDSPGTVTLRFRNSNFIRVGSTRAEQSNETVINNLIIALFAPSEEESGESGSESGSGGTEPDNPEIPMLSPTRSDWDLGGGDETPEGPVIKEPHAVSVFKYKFTGVYEEATVTFPLTSQIVDMLFDNEEHSCTMFVLANVPEELAKNLPENPTITEMKNLSITSDFDHYENDVLKDQESFIMSGEGIVTYIPGETGESTEGRATNLEPTKLYRAASKIRLNLNIENEVTAEDGTVWVPAIGEDYENVLRVSLNNGVCESVAYPNPVAQPNSDAYYDSKDRLLFNGRGTENGYPYGMEIPFYTYPNTWNNSFEVQTTMNLMVPWKKKDESGFRYFYYIVPVVEGDTSEINNNHSYIVNLNVGMLGGQEPEEALSVEATYVVQDWNDEEIGVKLDDYRYLVVNPNVLSVYNEENFQIPFYTSHPVTITNVTLSFERFAFVANPLYDDVGTVVTIPVTKSQIDETNAKDYGAPYEYILKYEESENNTNQKVISISHPLITWNPVLVNEEGEVDSEATFYSLIRRSVSDLKNFLSEINYYRPSSLSEVEKAYSPYTIKLYLQHTDNQNFKDSIIIHHYPAMYIQAERNNADRLADAAHLPPLGNVYVNGLSYISLGTPDGNGSLGALLGIILTSASATTNKNPNMYVVTTTQLSEDYNYIIGNPRSVHINNNLASKGNNLEDDVAIENTKDEGVTEDWCNSGHALYLGNGNDGERRLKYYYPTKEDELTKNMIAPKFRVASSWAAGSLYNLGGGSTEEARKEKLPKLFTLRTYARRRAATYQEQGYPAGRWRLPTFAEFSYMVQMAVEKRIPVLFTAGQGYWTAQGLAYFTGSDIHLVEYNDNPEKIKEQFGNFSNLNTNVRPVYDEWLWEQYEDFGSLKDSDGQYIYTLGDVPINYSAN